MTELEMRDLLLMGSVFYRVNQNGERTHIPMEEIMTQQTIGVQFDNQSRSYTYKLPHGITVKVGDRVMVDTPKNGPAAVTVVDVHLVPMPETTFKIKEILSVVNPAHEV